MWAIENNTPFEADRTWIRDKNGIHHWVVIVKATYDIGVSGELVLSEDPIEPLYAPIYHGEDGLSSIKYEADLVAMKPSTDIYLNAIAYTPNGKPSNNVKVGLSINNWKKELIVYGERYWQQNGVGLMTTTREERLIRMPIIYERSYGGTDFENPRNQIMDSKNPVGTGVYSLAAHIVDKPAPNIENISNGIKSKYPPGFGAIASYWSPRLELMGTYDKKWVDSRKPLLPLDYNVKSLMCAPLDQQAPAYMHGSALIQLNNLTPNGFLSFRLPMINLTFDTYFGSVKKQHFGQLVSIIIDSEGPKLILVWQSSLKCGNNCDYLDKTTIRYEEKFL